MPRRLVLLAALSTGCVIENRFGDQVPEWPHSVPPPVAAVTWKDEIVQVSTPQVDILWMVDNSCSMFDEQSALTENFPFFMDFFVGSGLDYHVGVTSSDIISSDYTGSMGTLVVFQGIKYLEPDTPNPIEVFTAMASLGTTGRFPEKGLGATYLALEENVDTSNAGFYRDEAALHTIIISDEPDFTQESLVTQPEYVQWYDGLKLETDLRTFSAIIDPARGTDYELTAEAVGGIVWDIHSENWPQVLERLGIQAAGLKREYFLSHRPVAGTITVAVDEVDGAHLEFAEAEVDPITGLVLDVDGDGQPDGDWTYDPDRNSVSFLEFIPDPLSTVVIEYTLLAAEQGQD